MTGGEHSLDMHKDYQSFAEQIQTLLWSDTSWQGTYAGYAEKLLKNRDEMTEKRKALGGPKALEPLQPYITIGSVDGRSGFDIDLRFLGQSVGSIKVKNGVALLRVKKEQAENSQEYFGDQYGAVGAFPWEDWKTGEKAKAFRSFFQTVSKEAFPRQKEHMVESALFSELGKEKGATKAKKGIQPVSCIPHVRLHMRTALAASKSVRELPSLSLAGNGGDIDVLCRRHGFGLVPANRSRLTVIEVKDENKSSESFPLAIKQAIAYAVFIRELVRSESGRDWMELWGLGRQPLEESLTIDAVVAMPKGTTTEFPFAGMKLALKGGSPGDITDWIELHYMAFLGENQPRDGQDVRFETSL